MNLFDFINQNKIKAIPESCFRSLCFVADKTYPVVITESVPSPRELLQLQISGQRIITLNENYTSWPTTRIDGRDILGFTLHDLIHADHFFGDPVFRDGQLGFFRFVESLLSDKDLNFLLGSSEKFSKGFEYVISDMNSHPLHMFQTLHALLFSELGDDSRASLIWNRWCGGSACLLAVNTIAFSLVDALAVEAYSKKMGSSGELPTNNLQFDTL